VDPDIANFGVVVAIIVGAAVALAPLTLWFIRGLKKNSQPRALPNALQFDQRFDQLQQSVDAIAVEVERIAEAQRFSARLLADRGETPALPR
jgi:hypothetical protein